jgi:hypothetical protein
MLQIGKNERKKKESRSMTMPKRGKKPREAQEYKSKIVAKFEASHTHPGGTQKCQQIQRRIQE